MGERGGWGEGIYNLYIELMTSAAFSALSQVKPGFACFKSPEMHFPTLNQSLDLCYCNVLSPPPGSIEYGAVNWARMFAQAQVVQNASLTLACCSHIVFVCYRSAPMFGSVRSGQAIRRWLLLRRG